MKIKRYSLSDQTQDWTSAPRADKLIVLNDLNVASGSGEFAVCGPPMFLVPGSPMFFFLMNFAKPIRLT